MTTPDIRAALERLVKTDDGCSAAEWSDAIAAARAALAEPVPPADGEAAVPVPAGPSDEELDLLVIAIQALASHQSDATTHNLASVDRGREILSEAVARWERLANR